MRIRLRYLARVNPATPEFDRLPDDAEVTFLPLEAVWPGNKLDVDRLRPKDQVSVGYTRFQEGDILVPKITPTFQADRTVIATGLSDGIGAGTTELHIVRVGPSADRSYVRYLLSSKPFLDEGEASMIGVAGQKRVPDDCLRDLIVPVTDAHQQRAIADYLDAETARIDALIEKKRRMVELLEERQIAIVEQAVRRLVDQYGAMPVKYATRRVEVGIVITPSAWYADEGVIALRGLNVQPGKIDLTDVVYISHEGHLVHQKSMLRAGDLVIVRTGQAGAAVVVPRTLDGCNCIDLVIVRPASALVPKFLEYVLNSDWTQKHIGEYSVGTIQSHFNIGAMKELPVPVPPLDEQQRATDELNSVTEEARRLADKLSRQIGLLTEHRQALVTAAVAGQLDIPGLAA